MIHRLKHHLKRHAHVVKHHLHNAFVPHEGNDHRPHALRHRALTAYAVVIILLKVVVSGFLIVYPGPSATANLTPTNIIQLTNAARQDRNLKLLKQNSKLANAAQLKAQDMLTKGYFAHVSPANVTPWYWFKKAGYVYTSAGENLAMDFVTAEDVTEAWLASPGHRKNLLNQKYVDIGVAVASGKIDGLSSTVVVQFFGAPALMKQKPKAVAKVTPTKPATPTQPSTVAVQTQAPALPPSPVLGETNEPPPLKPKLTSPQELEVLATARPWIGGEAQADKKIWLSHDGKPFGETVSDSQGYFRFQPATDLPDGPHNLTAVAVDANGSSDPSDPLAITIDTQPPSASLASTVILPSFVTPRAYSVFGRLQGDDVAEARVKLGSQSQSLVTTSGQFFAELTPLRGEEANSLEVELKDAVGNVSIVPLASLSFLDVEVATPSAVGFAGFVPKLLLFSRHFFITFWFLLLVALAINVLVKFRIQHRPMILYSLLLIYGLTIVIMTT